MQLSEYKQLFLTEAQEILSSLNKTLVDLEKDSKDESLLNELFRLIHTLKSMAQTMGYKNITQLTHTIESAMDLLKMGRLRADADLIALLFKSLDSLDTLIENVKAGQEKEIKISALLKEFNLLFSMHSSGKRKSPTIQIPQPGSQIDSTKKQDKEIQTHSSSRETKYVRIPLSQLDQLMDITGELVINRIQMDRISSKINDDPLAETVSQLSRLTNRLQDHMTRMRLVPLEYIFTPYHRLVRDMAVAEKKEIDLIIKGGSIGLDRSIQDEINEPLLHIIKNAVAHGIEMPAERKKSGKKSRGIITLSARRTGNTILIELSDDGRGIFIEEIKETAIKKSLISNEELDQLKPEEIVMLITYPGYSRAKSVTETAGRGMGLNAARIKVESLGGELIINSTPNEGATFKLKLPITMAIIQTLQVGLESETYCIPLSHITETIKVPINVIKTMEKHEIISYRDTVLPLVRLKDVFGFSSGNGVSGRSGGESSNTTVSIVVVEVGSRKAGLIVDRFSGQQDTVIKPLTGIMAQIKNISGATILGTGKVALIVDVPSIV